MLRGLPKSVTPFAAVAALKSNPQDGASGAGLLPPKPNPFTPRDNVVAKSWAQTHKAEIDAARTEQNTSKARAWEARFGGNVLAAAEAAIQAKQRPKTAIGGKSYAEMCLMPWARAKAELESLELSEWKKLHGAEYEEASRRTEVGRGGNK